MSQIWAMIMPSDPLSRFPGIRTSKPEEFEHQLIKIYGATKLHIGNPSGLNARGNWVQLQNIALGFSACDAPATVSFGECSFARLQIPLRGGGVTHCGKNSTLLTVGQPCLTSAHREVAFGYGRDFEHLVLRVDSSALEQKLTYLIGAQPCCQINFEPATFTSADMILGLRQLVEGIIRQLDAADTQLSPFALRELEQAVIVQFLTASRHNLSSLLEQDPQDGTPLHVRRVEAYIEANWDHAIAIEDLVDIAGVSARTLFKAFKRWRGFSPFGFAKRVRLERSRLLLSTRGRSVSVTGVAVACGFSNLGHFAREYRELFGEPPSQTLARSRSAS